MTVEVLRYNPENDQEPHLSSYQVPYDNQTSLLDALGYIKDKLEPSLSYRWSCRMAICGSCGMMVNNKPKLACKTFLRDYSGHMRIEPLANFPIERDLVVDLSHFIESLEAIKPYIIGNEAPALDGKNGVWSCTFVGYCSEVCPKHVDPASAINQGKVESAKDYVISMLKPKG